MSVFPTRPGLALFAAMCVGLSASALAQPSDAPAWQEAEVAPPTQFRTEGIATFVLDQSAAMVLAVDPATVAIGSDGVVRYVFVARSPNGALNVLFEGIRCQTAEVKTFAYWSATSGWHTDATAQWQALAFRGPTRRAMQMARGGVCEGRTPNNSAARIVETLRRGHNDIQRR